MRGKKLAGCGQPMELYKKRLRPGSDAFLYGAFKTRKQEVRGQQIQLVDEHLAAVLGLIDFLHVARRNYARHHDRWLRWVCETVGFNAQPCNVGTTQSVY